MRRRTIWTILLTAVVLLAAVGSAGRDEGAADAAQGYAPLSGEVSSKVLVRVLDTESSLGPLGIKPQDVTLGDLVRFHGHPCDGLVAAAEGVTLGLKSLFPEGVIDRTDVAVATNASPCYTDVAAFLTGARILYGTQVVDRTLGDEWFLLRRSTGRAVRVVLKPGVKPADLPDKEKMLRAGGCDRTLIRGVQALQSEFVKRLLASPPASLYEVTALPAFPYTVAGERPDAAKAGCRESAP